MLTKCIVDLVLGTVCLEANPTTVCSVVSVCAQQHRGARSDDTNMSSYIYVAHIRALNYS